MADDHAARIKASRKQLKELNFAGELSDEDYRHHMEALALNERVLNARAAGTDVPLPPPSGDEEKDRRAIEKALAKAQI